MTITARQLLAALTALPEDQLDLEVTYFNDGTHDPIASERPLEKVTLDTLGYEVSKNEIRQGSASFVNSLQHVLRFREDE